MFKNYTQGEKNNAACTGGNEKRRLSKPIDFFFIKKAKNETAQHEIKLTVSEDNAGDLSTKSTVSNPSDNIETTATKSINTDRAFNYDIGRYIMNVMS